MFMLTTVMNYFCSPWKFSLPEDDDHVCLAHCRIQLQGPNATPAPTSCLPTRVPGLQRQTAESGFMWVLGSELRPSHQ